MNNLEEKIIEELEEFGDHHDELCPCVQEEPDACDCDMGGLKPFIKKAIKEVQEETLREVEENKYY